MSAWTNDELAKIGTAEELQLAARRHDGSLRRPAGRWFHGAQQTHEGHIRAGGIDKDVAFVDADDTINDQIDAAYRTKYSRYADSYVPPMLSPDARATTLRLVPHAPDS